MMSRLAVVLGACFAVGFAVQPARETQEALRRHRQKAGNGTLTADESSKLKSVGACGVDITDSCAKVELVVGKVNSTALAFMDNATAFLNTASAKLTDVQSAASGMMDLVGIDGSRFTKIMDGVMEKVSHTLTVLNETNTKLKATLGDLVTKFHEEEAAINKSLVEAIVTVREGILKERDEASEAAESLVQLPPTSLRQEHATILIGPKAKATAALDKLSDAVDKVLDMLAELNVTALQALHTEVYEKASTSAHNMQDTLLSGLDKFPADIPAAVTQPMNATFDAFFEMLDKLSPEALNELIAPYIDAASEKVLSFKTCVEPLQMMAADLNAAWPRSSSWSIALALAVVSLWHAAAL